MRRSSIKVALALLSLTAAPSAAFAATGWQFKEHFATTGVSGKGVGKRCGSKQGTYKIRTTYKGLYPKDIVVYETLAFVVDGKLHKHHLVKLGGPEWKSASASQRAKLTQQMKASLAKIQVKTISVNGKVLVAQNYYKGKKSGGLVHDHLKQIHC